MGGKRDLDFVSCYNPKEVNICIFYCTCEMKGYFWYVMK